MKITKTRLKQIIKEELEAVIESEQGEINTILYLINGLLYSGRIRLSLITYVVEDILG